MSERTNDGPWTGNNDIVVTYRGIRIMENGYHLCHCYDCTKTERDAIDKELDGALELAKQMLNEPALSRTVIKTEVM